MVLELELEQTITKEQRLQGTKILINHTIADLARQIEQGLTLVQTTIAANPDGLTAEEVRAYYGEDNAVELDEIAVKAQELLSLVKVV